MCKQDNNTQTATGFRANLKAKVRKVAKNIGDCLAKHHLLGKRRYESWHAGERGHKCKQQPACPPAAAAAANNNDTDDEETHSLPKTLRKRGGKQRDARKLAMAKHPRLKHYPTIHGDYIDPADVYYSRSNKVQKTPVTELTPGNQFVGGTSVVTKLGEGANKNNKNKNKNKNNKKTKSVQPKKDKELAIGSKMMGSKAVIPAEFTKKEGKRPMPTLPLCVLMGPPETGSVREKSSSTVKSVRFSRPITKPGECSRDPWGWRKTSSGEKEY